MGRHYIDADELIELIGDDMATLNFIDMSREGHDVCLCTLNMVKQYIKALSTVPLDWKSIMDDWTEHDNAMIAKGREIERRLNAPKHGRWVEDEYGIPHCSECKAINNTVYRNFCPNCGARMFDKDTDVPDKNVGKMDEVKE